jgi:hypothetical protein
MTFCQKGHTMECLGFSDRELSQWAVQQAATSIARAHGLRSDGGVMAYVLGPDAEDASVREGYISYRIGGDDKYVYSRFKSYVRMGHVVLGVIEDGGEVRARFGVELFDGYVSMLYVEGSGMDRWIRELIDVLMRIGAANARFMEEPVLYIKGRPGWRRIIRRLGIEIDHNGFVAGWQEALRNG